MYIYIYIYIYYMRIYRTLMFAELMFAACPLLIFAAWISAHNPHIILRVGLT